MNLTRRSVLGFGGLAAAAALSACGSNTGLGGKESSGGGPTLTQWYHQYEEEKVKEAVERYAAEYTAAKVDVKWNPGDYGSILLRSTQRKSYGISSDRFQSRRHIIKQPPLLPATV